MREGNRCLSRRGMLRAIGAAGGGLAVGRWLEAAAVGAQESQAEHGGQIEFQIAALDAVSREFFLRLREPLAGLQQRFAGDAANAKAGSPQRGDLLNTGDIQAQLGRTNRSNVPARPGADNNQIMLD